MIAYTNLLIEKFVNKICKFQYSVLQIYIKFKLFRYLERVLSLSHYYNYLNINLQKENYQIDCIIMYKNFSYFLSS